MNCQDHINHIETAQSNTACRETTTASYKPSGDVYSADCPCRELLDVLSGKWSVLIIESLQAGHMRFGELQRRMEGISAKVLTANLRRLESAGLITRQIFAEVPVRVEYSLTADGISAVEPLRGLRIWAESHYDQALALTSR
jgi:DNA-binding HxlR family transcriptional regulator